MATKFISTCKIKDARPPSHNDPIHHDFFFNRANKSPDEGGGGIKNR